MTGNTLNMNRMIRSEILGEVALDRDGVLHGWCWSPTRPAERLTVEILVEDEVAASVVASRFREDVRNRRFGDGYHGFTVTLTKHLSAKPGLVRARERVSGRVFWQKSFSEIGIPAGFDGQLDGVKSAIGDTVLTEALAGPQKLARLLSAFDGVGRRLRGGRFPGGDAPAVRLPTVTAPAISIILDVGDDSETVFNMVAAAAGLFGAIGAELILLDSGADPRGVFLAGRLAGAKYFYGADATPARLRNDAAAAANGKTLLFLHNDGRGFGLGLQAFAATTETIAGSGLAAQAAWLRPDAAARLISGKPMPYLGLDLAIPRDIFAAAGGFNEAAAAPEAELLLRCLDFGTAAIWREPRLPGMPGADGCLPLA
jgi:hypothetical protein